MTTLDVRMGSQFGLRNTILQTKYFLLHASLYKVFWHMRFDHYELIIGVIYQCSYWFRISAQ